MPTTKQLLGSSGETLICKRCSCPKCKRSRTFKRLPTNFKCADVICDFCGFLAQVKTLNRRNVECVPQRVTGAAWEPQASRMASGIYFPVYFVLVNGSRRAVYYLSADHQNPAMFKPRQPLSSQARRAGWQGFEYDLSLVIDAGLVRLAE
ncbi:MAG: hypothetical protein IT436_11995 [Phycisphaerales bacterium]|nr:hypothetical protein [Phycisphaerales bacterium]